MESNIYGEIQPEYQWIADKLEDMELEYKAYNRGIQYNVTDADGIIQTYYPSTGTIVFHASNDRRIKTLKERSLDDFLSFITETGAIKNLFR